MRLYFPDVTTVVRDTRSPYHLNPPFPLDVLGPSRLGPQVPTQVFGRKGLETRLLSSFLFQDRKFYECWTTPLL